MATPLQQDVCDVMEACDNLGALFLSRLRTKTGNELKREVYEQLERRQKLVENLASRCKTLEAEVDGLRTQNANLTQVLQGALADVERFAALLRKTQDERNALYEKLYPSRQEID